MHRPPEPEAVCFKWASRVEVLLRLLIAPSPALRHLHAEQRELSAAGAGLSRLEDRRAKK